MAHQRWVMAPGELLPDGTYNVRCGDNWRTCDSQSHPGLLHATSLEAVAEAVAVGKGVFTTSGLQAEEATFEDGVLIVMFANPRWRGSTYTYTTDYWFFMIEVLAPATEDEVQAAIRNLQGGVT